MYLIWNYSRNYAFDLPFSSDVELPENFNPYEDIELRRMTGIIDFELEFLLKEIIANCQHGKTKHSLKQKKYLARLINYLRHTFSSEIDKRFNIPGDILLEFNRLAHRQFKWQSSQFNNFTTFRYYKIYSDKNVNSIIENKLHLSSFELFFIGLYLFRSTAQYFRVTLPIESEIPILTTKMFQNYLENFSMSIEQAKKEIILNREMNENIFYSYNPLRAKPILTYENTYFCPIPLLLYWQTTDGIYYSIVKEKGFENAFGASFEKYIGEVLSLACDSNRFEILPESTYGKEEKKTIDWRLIDDAGILFVECKTKRLTLGAKSNLAPKDGLNRDLTKMAGFIVQNYKTYLDYKSGAYPDMSFDEDKEFYPLVLTLEPWYINFNPRIMDMLESLVIQLLQSSSIDPIIIERHPYHIRSSEDFEKDIQLINALGIQEYFSKIWENEIHDFMDGFEYIDLFKGEFEKTFLNPLSDILDD